MGVLVRREAGRTHEGQSIPRGANRGDPARSCRGRRGARALPAPRVTETTFYRWRRQYGGLRVNETKRLKALEEENRRLKKLVADLSLDNAMLKDVAGRKW